MFALIFEQLVKMFFIMLLAFVCYRIKLVNQEGNRSISNLLLMVVNPLVILTVYQTGYDPELVRGLFLPSENRSGLLYRTVQRHVLKLRFHWHPADQ